MAASDPRFYEALPRFSDFARFADDIHYQPVPDDWTVFVTDVEGSTRAIGDGRYKDVNTVGAASITAALNAAKREVPFVFGGDGASLAVPPEARDAVRSALCAVAALSRDQFGLELRVGAVPVADLRAQGAQLEVARYELAAGRCIALFRGGGLALADQRIKEEGTPYRCEVDDDASADLNGLSCRWNPIPSRRGVVLSVLVESRRSGESDSYAEILAEIDRRFDGQLASVNPVALRDMRYKTIGQCLSEERRYHASAWSPAFWLRAVEIVVAVLIFGHGMPAVFFDSEHYANAMRVHADYHKFDDMLRMVVDCTREEADAVVAYLEEAHAAGRLYYGVHEASAALMTCLVDSLDDGGHIHFIDGDDGGYARAAVGLKAQKRAA